MHLNAAPVVVGPGPSATGSEMLAVTVEWRRHRHNMEQRWRGKVAGQSKAGALGPLGRDAPPAPRNLHHKRRWMSKLLPCFDGTAEAACGWRRSRRQRCICSWPWTLPIMPPLSTTCYKWRPSRTLVPSTTSTIVLARIQRGNIPTCARRTCAFSYIYRRLDSTSSLSGGAASRLRQTQSPPPAE